MLFDAEGVIHKYASPEDILRDFYDLRLAYYAKRRAALLRVRMRCRLAGWPAGAAAAAVMCWLCTGLPLIPPAFPPTATRPQAAEADLCRISNKVRGSSAA